MNIDKVNAVLDAAPRIKELLEKYAANHIVQERLTEEQVSIEKEIEQLTGITPESVTKRKPQTCKVCGSTEHNARFHKEK